MVPDAYSACHIKSTSRRSPKLLRAMGEALDLGGQGC